MKVYSLKLKDFYENFSIKDFSDDENDKFEGIECLNNEWEEKSLKVVGKGKKADIVFCFYPIHNLIMSEKIVKLLQNQLKHEDIELLPVKKGKDKYYILHGIKAYRMYHENVKKGIKFYHKFDEKELTMLEIENKLFFRGLFNNGVISQLFYTEKFVDFVNEHGLQGVDFEVAWDSEVDQVDLNQDIS